MELDDCWRPSIITSQPHSVISEILRFMLLCGSPGINRRGASHNSSDFLACPFQGFTQLYSPSSSKTLTGTGTTMKSHGPVALKGTVWRGREEVHHYDAVSPFCFFLPFLLRAPEPDTAVVRHILQPKFATCHHILEPTFEFCFRSLNSKIASYHSNFLGQSLCIGCDCAYENLLALWVINWISLPPSLGCHKFIEWKTNPSWRTGGSLYVL